MSELTLIFILKKVIFPVIIISFIYDLKNNHKEKISLLTFVLTYITILLEKYYFNYNVDFIDFIILYIAFPVSIIYGIYYIIKNPIN